MRRKYRLAAVACCVVMALVAGGILAVLRALRYEPEFYRQAMAADPASQRRFSDEMLRQTGAFWSDVRNKDHWEVRITAEQINGWLAVDLKENHPTALPESIADPRLAIRPDGITLGCRLRQGDFSGVFSLAVEPYLAEPNALGLRIRRARVGLLPWPLTQITDGISHAARNTELSLQWLQANGDPVVLILFPSLGDDEDKGVQIETLRLGDGEIYLAGSTRKRVAARGRGSWSVAR